MLFVPVDVVQNLQIYLVSSTCWLKSWENHEVLTKHEMHWNTNRYHCWCCPVCQLAYYFFIHILTHSEQSYLISSAEEQVAHLGRTKTWLLCSYSASIIMCHPHCPGRWLHTGFSIISVCIYPLWGVSVTLAVLLDVVQEFFHTHRIPLCCFPKKQRRERAWVVFITLEVFHSMWLFSR